MRAGQWERGEVVVERRVGPDVRAVAQRTVRREPGGDVVRIGRGGVVLGVAAVAIAWRSLEATADMARQAVQTRVCAG